MSAINLFITNMIHFINVNINNIWPGEQGGPRHNNPGGERAGGVEPGSAGQDGPSEHLRAADNHSMETFAEDDPHLDIGQGTAENSLRVMRYSLKFSGSYSLKFLGSYSLKF